MKKTDSTPLRDKVAYLGVFLALALICSYVESLIPFYFGIPGVKIIFSIQNAITEYNFTLLQGRIY